LFESAKLLQFNHDDEEVFTSSAVEEAYSHETTETTPVTSSSNSDKDDTTTTDLQRRLLTLNQLRLNGWCCDVMLTSDIDGQEYPCHRVVLAACSDYFRAMFTAHMRESDQDRIMVHGISGNELAQIVQFMYTGEIELETNDCDVIQLVSLAVYYQIETLVHRCVSYMVGVMTADDCCSMAWISRELSLTKLANAALQFVARNLHRLYDVTELELISADDLVSCLKNVDYNTELASTAELGILKSCIRWCAANMQIESRHSEVMTNVRYALINKTDIEKISAENEDDARTSKAVAEWLRTATSYHDNIYKQPLVQDENTQLRGDQSNFVVVDGVVSQNPVRVQPESNRISVANDNIAAVQMEVQEEEEENTGPIRDPFHNVVEMGGFVYVLGGTRVQHSGFSQVVERYDPRVDQWISVAPMLEERADFTSCVLDGCIIVAGGRGRRRYLDTCEKYNPETNTWSYISRLPQAMYMAAAVVCRGTLYMSGGFNEYEALDEMICYHPEEDEWESLPGMMMKCRGYHVMVESPTDGRLWVVGGIDNPFAGRNVWKIEAWNVDLCRWQYVGEILPVKMFTSTMRLNVATNARSNITVFPVTHAQKYGAVEFYMDRKMWLESKNPTPVYDIEVDAAESSSEVV